MIGRFGWIDLQEFLDGYRFKWFLFRRSWEESVREEVSGVRSLSRE